MFGTLESSKESRKRRGVALLCGLLAEVLVIGAAAFVGLLFPDELPEASHRFAVTWLAALKPPEPALKPPAPKIVRVVLPKIKPLETPALTAPPLAVLAVPKVRPAPPSAALHVPEPPPPAAAAAQPRPEPKVQIPVQTGLFGGAPEPVTTKLPMGKVQTGGFGSPQGFAGSAHGESAGNVPKLGAFGLPEGPGHGNGTGGAKGVPGVVASAGFGSGIAGPGSGRSGLGVAVGGFGGTSTAAPAPSGDPKVAMGGFEKAAPVAPSPAAKPLAPPPTVFQPVEIFSKPTPAYTEEARRLGIQGEVTLSVVFQASGAIKVIGVVKSLGHGLDQAAEQAATQIRFKPALRDGKPADFPATLRIEFRLADQSS